MDLVLIREQEAAEMLGVRPNTLRIWRSKGKPPRFLRISRSIFYNKKDILDFIESSYVDFQKESGK